jgi:hypothetical protein
MPVALLDEEELRILRSDLAEQLHAERLVPFSPSGHRARIASDAAG